MMHAPPEISVTEIGEYIRHRSCERRFKLGANNRRIAKQLPFAERLFNTLDPVLEEAGRQRESEWEASLRRSGLLDLTRYGERPETAKAMIWAAFRALLADIRPGQSVYGREVAIAAELGALRLKGQIDFVVVLWRDGKARLRLVECKASRRDHTYHRIQVALYQLLLRELMAADPLVIAGVVVDPRDVECVVARIDERTNASQSILTLEPLDLETEEADLRRLVAEDGALLRILHADLNALDYQLDEKCDGCVFNVYCLPESARQRRLELLGIAPSSVRVLRAVGIRTIDDLAGLDLDGWPAERIRAEPGFSESLEQLQLRAKTRAHTLPGGGVDLASHEVQPLPHTGRGQLPAHEIDGVRLVRVYLLVDYDYAENRIGALTAHVTASDRQLHTDFVLAEDGRWTPDPEVKERWIVERDADDRPVYQTGPLSDQDKDIIEFVSSEWTGRYEIDTGTEKQLIQGFFQKVIDAIADVAATEYAPIHFYVWSRAEMTQLVEACSRVSSQLLGHLSQLLGCRESLEQLIYSSLQDEVDRRYALGWTGRGLAVAASLRWFGRRYHWQRRIAGVNVSLDRAFTQDIFDFKTTLRLGLDGQWADPDDQTAPRQMFEIRSRFHDSLTAPYWRAYWRTLPSPEAVHKRDSRLASAIRRYNEAANPGYLRAYLRARAHALRWIEEGIRFKNDEIAKPLVTIAKLPAFTLGVEDAAQASIDFLRLDHHVQVTDWIAAQLVPPIARVPSGRTIPVRDVLALAPGSLTARIDLEAYGLDGDALAARSSFGAGDMVRLSPSSGDPYQGQSVRQLLHGGITCSVASIEWGTGLVELEAIPQYQSSRYKLFSGAASESGLVFDHATIDENASDFVADRVDERLSAGRGAHAHQWFDPAMPRIPPQAPLEARRFEQLQTLVATLALPNDQRLAADQAAACIDGLHSRVQLLLGPPGTGKTATTAVSVLLRILARRHLGDIVLIAANTHLAIDNVLQRIDAVADAFAKAADASGLDMPVVKLRKVHSTEIGSQPGGRVQDFVAKPSAQYLNRERADAVLVIGGTTSAILKLARELGGKTPWNKSPDQFQAAALIVDEASMMVFPHFLALATLVQRDGEIMIAGDHRQLAPIVAHDWEHEDRPPAVAYQPFVSAYTAIDNIGQHPAVPKDAVLRSALRFTFRLPPEIRELIARLYHRLDAVELRGRPRTDESQSSRARADGWARLWSSPSGLYLVVHDERQSKQSNMVEAQIIDRILAAGGEQPPGSIAIVTPHRAQRSLLMLRLMDEDSVGVIDTVERLQGGERDTVIVSGTVSDPAAIGTQTEFILDLNRSNVAFSRARRRLMVVCAETLLDYIPVEVEDYESAMLWKALRSLCCRLVARARVDGHSVQIFTLPPARFSP